MVEKEQIIDALKGCQDPELQIDVWTLGLIYDVGIKDDAVDIKMTFTSVGCPYGPWLVDDLKAKVGAVAGVKEVNVEVTFTPPWEPSEEVKIMLGVE